MPSEGQISTQLLLPISESREMRIVLVLTTLFSPVPSNSQEALDFFIVLTQQYNPGYIQSPGVVCTFQKMCLCTFQKLCVPFRRRRSSCMHLAYISTPCSTLVSVSGTQWQLTESWPLNGTEKVYGILTGAAHRGRSRSRLSLGNTWLLHVLPSLNTAAVREGPARGAQELVKGPALWGLIYELQAL